MKAQSKTKRNQNNKGAESRPLGEGRAARSPAETGGQVQRTQGNSLSPVPKLPRANLLTARGDAPARVRVTKHLFAHLLQVKALFADNCQQARPDRDTGGEPHTPEAAL